MIRVISLLAVIGVGLTLSSCGLLQSDARSVERRIKSLQDLISKEKFKDARKLCNPTKFRWIQNGKTYSKRGESAAKAFLKSIEAIGNRQSVLIRVKASKVKDYFIAGGTFQIMQSTATRPESVKFEVAFKVKKNDKGIWLITEVKEKGKRVKKRGA